MDRQIISNAIGGLDELLSQARRALFEISRDHFVGGEVDDQGSYAEPKEALAGLLSELHDVLLIVLEAAQMPEARLNLIEQWAKFTSAKGGLRAVHVHPDYDVFTSSAFSSCEHIVNALRMTVSNDLTTEQGWTLARLEAMLRDTAGLLLKRKVAPANENELQDVMHDYLSACFADFRLNPQIGGSIKNFIPDSGIAGVGAAIEFKIAHTQQKAVQAFTGIVEDVGGFTGSKDWTRFYAVMYQAKPFIRESQLQSDMKRIKAATWKAILINGETNPKDKRKSTSASKKKI